MKNPLKKVSQTKAKEILRHGKVHGEDLSKKQKGYFGVIAGGETPIKKKAKFGSTVIW